MEKRGDINLNYTPDNELRLNSEKRSSHRAAVEALDDDASKRFAEKATKATKPVN